MTAVDIIPEKVELINNKKSPIQDEYIEKYLAEKELDLTATLDAKEAYLPPHHPPPEERIWAGRTPRAPDAPKIKHNGMKRFYMVDMGVKNVILSFYQKKCESLSLAKEKSLSQ